MSGKDLKEKLKAAGVNLSELSKLMGYKTDQNLHSVLGAKEMNSSVIERMAEVLGKPIGWFYGEEELVAEPERERETEPDTVPLLPIFAQAGSLVGWSEGIEEVKCERVISPVKDVDMAVHIYGESMSPDIPNGAVCYVRRVTGRVIDYGRAYILDTVDGPVVKYLAPGPDGKPIEKDCSSNWARHTWATMCAELDVPDPTISLGMGHRIAGHRTTAIYIKRDQRKVDEANRLVIDYIKGSRPASHDAGRERN